MGVKNVLTEKQLKFLKEMAAEYRSLLLCSINNCIMEIEHEQSFKKALPESILKRAEGRINENIQEYENRKKSLCQECEEADELVKFFEEIKEADTIRIIHESAGDNHECVE